MDGVTGVIGYFGRVGELKMYQPRQNNPRIWHFFYMAGVTGVISNFKRVDINFGVKVKIWRGVFLYGRGNRGNRLLWKSRRT